MGNGESTDRVDSLEPRRESKACIADATSIIDIINVNDFPLPTSYSPPLSLGIVLHQGLLEKKSPHLFGPWQQRLFVLACLPRIPESLEFYNLSSPPSNHSLLVLHYYEVCKKSSLRLCGHLILNEESYSCELQRRGLYVSLLYIYPSEETSTTKMQDKSKHFISRVYELRAYSIDDAEAWEALLSPHMTSSNIHDTVEFCPTFDVTPAIMLHRKSLAYFNELLCKDCGNAKTKFADDPSVNKISISSDHVCVSDMNTNVMTVGADGSTILHRACRSGNVNVVKHLACLATVDVDLLDSDGCSPLHIVARCGWTDLITILVKNGADVNLKSRSNGASPLLVACICGNASSVCVLLGLGAEVNASDCNEFNAISLACIGDHATCIAAVVDWVNINSSTPEQAIFTLLEHCDCDSLTPLMRACVNGSDACVRLLISLGASFEETSLNGATAIMWALQYARITTAMILLTSGAKVNVRDNRGNEPLQMALALREDTLINKMQDTLAESGYCSVSPSTDGST